MKNTLALAAACLAALMFGLEVSSVPVILPTLGKVLHGDFADMQWIMSAYTLACTTILMGAGTLADRYGRKRIFVLGLGLFGIASLICGVAQSTAVLIFSRFVQGIGGGAMLICLTAILSHQFQERRERSRAFGIWGIVFGTGLGFGPMAGGLIVATLNWHWVFLIHVPLTVVTIALVCGTVRESSDPQAQKLDIAGIVTLSSSVFGLVYYIMEGPRLGFTSPAGIGIVAAALVGFTLFIFVEKRSSYPMFDLSVFWIRPFSGAILGSVGVNFCFWPLLVYLPIYFQNGLGYDSATTGLLLLAYTLPVLVFPPLGEYLALRHSPRMVISSGIFVIGIGLLLMKAGSSIEAANWMTILPGCVLAGAGLGIANTPATNTATGSVPPGRAGMASGIDMSARLITLAINIALMGFVVLQGVQSSLRDAIPATAATAPLPAFAERIVAGDLPSPGGSDPLAELPKTAIRAALQHGFGLAMIYGGLGAWVLAASSLLVFGFKPVSGSRRASSHRDEPDVPIGRVD